MAGDKHDLSYYLKCMVGGALACGLTHAAVTPMDLVKCRRQINPSLYPNLVSGIKTVAAKEGMSGVFTGWFPTLVGYSLQGLGKYGFYEFFKDVYSKAVGSENAIKYRVLGWSISSACAEVIADTLLCPMESVKVKM